MKNQRVEFIVVGLILLATGLVAWFLLNLKATNASSAFFGIFGLWLILLASSVLSLIWLVRLMLRENSLKAAGQFLVWQGIIGIVIISNFKSGDLNTPLLIFLAAGLYLVSGFTLYVKAYKLAPPPPTEAANSLIPQPNAAVYPPMLRRKGLPLTSIIILGVLGLLIVWMLFVFVGISVGRPVPTPTSIFQYLTPTAIPQPTPPRELFIRAHRGRLSTLVCIV